MQSLGCPQQLSQIEHLQRQLTLAPNRIEDISNRAKHLFYVILRECRLKRRLTKLIRRIVVLTNDGSDSDVKDRAGNEELVRETICVEKVGRKCGFGGCND